MKKLISLLLALVLAASLGVGAFAANDTASAPVTLSFDQVQTRVTENNASVKALQESIAVIDSIDYKKMYETSKEGLDNLANALFVLSSTGMTSSLKEAQESLADTLETMTDGTFQRDNDLTSHQLTNLIDQVTFGAQTLYITICATEQQLTDAERGLAALDRSLAAMEKSHQLGQVSDLDLLKLQSTRTSTASTIETLKLNIANMKSNLLVLIGEDPTAQLTVSPLPEVPANALTTMNYDNDLAAARAASYELHNADVTLERAKKQFDDDAEDYHYGTFVGDSYRYQMALHTYQAAENTCAAAHSNYDLSFLQLFRNVSDCKQQLDAANVALNYQNASFESSKVQYGRGMISANAYKDAEDALTAAQSAVTTANVSYLTAWNKYTWAVGTGILG